MLEYLFTIQKTVSLSTDKAGLLLIPDHSIHSRRLTTFCLMQFLDQLSDLVPLVNQKLNMQKNNTKHYSA